MNPRPSSRKQAGQHTPLRVCSDIYITRSMVQEFLDALSETRPNANSLQAYRNALRIFCRDFPEDRPVSKEGLQGWCEELLETEYELSSVNQLITVVNELLNYHGLRQYQIKRFAEAKTVEQTQLSRDEYRRILQTARQNGMKREYLMAKLFASTGISVYELISLSAEDLYKKELSLDLPESLRRELLDYAERNGVETGAIFRNANGDVPCRSLVNVWLWNLANAAELPKEKVTPRNLQKLFYEIKADVEQEAGLLIDYEMERLAELEEQVVGWNC